MNSFLWVVFGDPARDTEPLEGRGALRRRGLFPAFWQEIQSSYSISYDRLHLKS